MAEKLKITLVKSPIGAVPKQKATMEALGLKEDAQDGRDAGQRRRQRHDPDGQTSGKGRRSLITDRE